MEQSWSRFWAGVSEAFHQALLPFHAAAAAFGLQPTDIQIWCFLCGVFFLALVGSQTYGDIVLSRRGAFAKGRVVGLDTSGEYSDTPIIEFADRAGRVWRFGSHLPANAATRSIGAPVDVMYDPMHPTRAREVGRPLMKALHVTIGYAVVVVLMVLAFWRGPMSN
ncbi:MULTISPECIES: DUF3592 domain-containing protein [unclassified Mesorhizobium]|uniref:DUF3592 domain-containing protein n=1 Tax=unclassified Mesorhizobium TaxID=325217 RepID=UPI00086EE893|nr:MULTISPECIES: DUF3592 domain-containing protein [unclassified Mesorhizobium]MBN9258274.1 DUF3592 domain-containing protein [Mesorhizobium sp.]MBN9269913.1 DUF3592 domain-containing protein [Mesorhizobium sp.]ODT15264.1 MAG: hypothetical protein ABS57_13635 [Mesorhizobium sp. SCN 65-12]OJX82411.1 MAG: hypothetical protein BGO93_24795 [Mesorhizobium sp. 65-26]